MLKDAVARRHRRSLSSCRGTPQCTTSSTEFRCAGGFQGSTSSAESFVATLGRVFRCVASRCWANFAGLDVIGAVSYVVPRVVALRDVIDGASSLCCGLSPGALSSAETLVAP